jgi:DoxX-like family
VPRSSPNTKERERRNEVGSKSNYRLIVADHRRLWFVYGDVAVAGAFSGSFDFGTREKVRMDLQQFALDIRIVVAAVFVLAGLLKTIARSAPDQLAVLNAIGFSPSRLAQLAVRVLPLAEIALAGWLLSGWKTVEALIAAAIVFLMFSIIIVFAIKRGYQGRCSCFGPTSGPLGIANIVLNAFLLGGALFAMVAEHRASQRALWIADARMSDALAIAFLAFFLSALHLVIRQVESINRMLEQQTKNKVIED